MPTVSLNGSFRLGSGLPSGGAGTMPSADSSLFAVAAGGPSPLPLFGGGRPLCHPFPPARPPEVSHASFPPPTCRIYVRGFRAAIGLRLVLQPRPPRPPDAVPVRQARGLPPASFRLRLAADALAIGCALPAAGRARDSHPSETCACSAHRQGRGEEVLLRALSSKRYLCRRASSASLIARRA